MALQNLQNLPEEGREISERSAALLEHWMSFHLEKEIKRILRLRSINVIDTMLYNTFTNTLPKLGSKIPIVQPNNR